MKRSETNKLIADLAALYRWPKPTKEELTALQTALDGRNRVTVSTTAGRASKHCQRMRRKFTVADLVAALRTQSHAAPQQPTDRPPIRFGLPLGAETKRIGMDGVAMARRALQEGGGQ